MAGSTEARQVGYGFKPSEQELVGHFLKKKLEGEMRNHPAFAEANIYEFEPSQVFKIYDLMSDECSHGRECFFFCAGGRKRTTSSGYWKETGRKSFIRASGTNEAIGFKRIFVYHEGKQPKGCKTDVVNHEYHYGNSNGETSDRMVLCRIMKKKSKKAKSARAGASADLSSHLNGAQANPGVTVQSAYPTEMPIPEQRQ